MEDLTTKQFCEAGLSLLFTAGSRPDAAAVENALARQPDSKTRAAISFRPETDEGWLELLSSGLTFDLKGLSPASTMTVLSASQSFGLNTSDSDDSLEALTLLPGPHIAAGAAMLPVVRAMSGLAAALSASLAPVALCWHPARTWMAPAYFQRTIEAWLSGGAFPALGLTAITPGEDGIVESAGLAFFTGQEVRVFPGSGEPVADTVKLAVRVIDYLVRSGRLTDPLSLDGPDGEPLVITPSLDERLLTVRRNTE